MTSKTRAENDRYGTALLFGALIVGLLVRLATWPQVFLGGQIWIDGPDGYYHLRRAWLTLREWPFTPQTDMLIGVPEGGPISWPPLFDFLLATLALPWREDAAGSLERIGALLPPLLGMLEIVLLFLVVRRLFGATPAGWSALVAAFLPGVSRYSLLGALDHDPLVESLSLLALFGLAGGVSGASSKWSDVAWFVAGVTLLFLTWAGALLHLGLFVLLLLVDFRVLRSRRESALAKTLGVGSFLSVLILLPFVIQSVWTERMGATFIGLSWLHAAALLGVAVIGLAMAVWTQPRRLLVVFLVLATTGLLSLLGSAWTAFEEGFSFFIRGEPFLRGVMESRPLLSLFGPLDLKAPIVRLSLLPLLIPVLLPWSLRRSEEVRRTLFLWVWVLYTIAIALVQSRYAHAAALAVAALAGILVSNVGRLVSTNRARFAGAVVLLLVVAPSVPAYLLTPGFGSFRMYARLPKIISTGMFEACDYLRQEAGPSESWTDHRAVSSSAVLAPWSAGHWLIWRGRQGTVTTPLGPQGQPAFGDGIRFYVESDPAKARRLLDRHRVRYFVATAEIPPLEAYVELAGVAPDLLFSVGDGPGPWPLDAEKYLATSAARLAWIGTQELDLFGRRLPALEGYEEVFRSSESRPNPFASMPIHGVPRHVPRIRIYSVEKHPESERFGLSQAAGRDSTDENRGDEAPGQ